LKKSQFQKSQFIFNDIRQ